MSQTQPLSVECFVQVSEGIALPDAVDEASVASLVRFALETEGQRGEWSVTFAFVTEAEISQLHKKFVGDPSPTDIITFPFGEPDACGGDVAICVPVAAEQGPSHGKTLDEELFFLVLHGVLHLEGYDDEDPEMRSTMLATQEEILQGWLAINR